MTCLATTLLLAETAVSEPLRGAALIALVLAGGGLGILVIVGLAWSRRRRQPRRLAGRAAGPVPDAWRESARRVQVDPEEDDS